ncbi:hypothetical protein VARIO8X_90042 [Burkholderiales bacterium 8X]|nr:hypothetical protein VARIO8X_90042 [Burkholderiales bacterium 8X]
MLLLLHIAAPSGPFFVSAPPAHRARCPHLATVRGWSYLGKGYIPARWPVDNLARFHRRQNA